MKSVGLIGLGNVGIYYVKKLLDAGYPLTVFDIDHNRIDAAVRQVKNRQIRQHRLRQIQILLF